MGIQEFRLMDRDMAVTLSLGLLYGSDVTVDINLMVKPASHVRRQEIGVTQHLNVIVSFKKCVSFKNVLLIRWCTANL